ncbi:ImmA/IrrE family metallo-endopeptidase [Hyphomicrobium sp. DY-1]|uniref:ImmA/IrrE family metallo-endopeptidase n=1 Tax=Hyphomicrobium sp. DY-1 TaxID=3075650 RepID=UPI0039C16E85
MRNGLQYDSAMVHALVTGEVLKWARQRAGLTVDIVADKLKVTPEDVLEWEEDRGLPSFAKARDLAKLLRVPFGYFFLEKPPHETVAIADLRRLGDDTAQALGADFMAVYQDAKNKQAWYRDHLIASGADELDFVGSASIRDSAITVAQTIRETLGVDAEWRRGCPNWEAMFRGLVDKTETAGILVLRNSLVGNNTHRKLSVNEFRGFALSDGYAPLIFVNTGDSAAAQIFSLCHELVHIWINESAISNFGISTSTEGYDPIEVFCNKVAAEFLVSQAEFRERWNETLTLQENADALAREFKVSTIVIARRALDLGRIDRGAYTAFVRAATDAFEARQEATHEKGSGGPDFYVMAKLRNSPTFARAVLREAFEGRLLLRDAGALLSVKPSKLRDLQREVG